MKRGRFQGAMSESDSVSVSLGSEDSDEIFSGIRQDENFEYTGYPSDWGSDEELMYEEAGPVSPDYSVARRHAGQVIEVWDEDEEVPPTLPVPDTPVPARMDSPRAPEAPGRPFRLNAKKFFLTYPQCDTGPVSAMEALRTKFGENLVSCVVGQEMHQDGHLHLHVALELARPVDTRDAHYFDFVTGTHGNYQGARDWCKVLRYCTKEGRFISFGIDPLAYLQAREKKKSTSFAQVAGRMMEGASIADLTSEVPGFVLQHLTKMKQFNSHLASLKSHDGPLIPLPPVVPEGTPLLISAVYDWILKNVRKPRRFGSPNLAIVGPTGIGKTTFLLSLRKYCRMYWVPMDENFFDTYDDDAYDLLVFDEYKSQKTIQFMNSFCQGAPFQLRTKGGQTMKRKNLPVILLSNYTAQEMYPNVWQEQPTILDAFTRRFTWVNLDVDHTLFRMAAFLDPEFAE